MSDLSNIRTLEQLEYEREILRLKSAQEELKVRQDFEGIRRTYTTVSGFINGFRSGIAGLRLIAPIALPILRFFLSRRRCRRR